MALVTLGTTANNSLSALAWNPMSAQADIAAIAAAIKDQSNPAHPIEPGAFTNSGQLMLPNGRGIIRLQPGDYVAYDSFGWPIVVSAQSIADGSTVWVHT